MPSAVPQADITVIHHEIAASGAVVARIAVSAPEESRGLRLVILPTGELGGFTPAVALNGAPRPSGPWGWGRAEHASVLEAGS